MTKLSLKYLFAIALLSHSVLLLFLMTTNPYKLPVIFLLITLIWAYGCLTSLVLLVIKILRPEELFGTRQILYSAILAAVPTGMLLLRSIDQLTVKDLVLIGILASLGLFYFTRFRFSRKIE